MDVGLEAGERRNNKQEIELVMRQKREKMAEKVRDIIKHIVT